MLSYTLIFNQTSYNITNNVIPDSLNLSYNLFNKDLKPTTNKASFRVKLPQNLYELLLAYQSDIQVEIKDGSTFLFKGYISDNYSFNLSNIGRLPIEISAEDVGIRYLKKVWVSSNGLYTLINSKELSKPSDAVNSAIHILSALAGIAVSSSIPSVSSLITLNIQDSDNFTYWDVLEKLCYEFGYIFYITNDGKLSLYKVAKTSITSIATFTPSSNIVSENAKSGLEIKKNLIAYKQVNIEYDEWESKENLYVFRDTTGGTATYDCLIPLAPNAYYPEGADAETFVFPEYKLESGQDIINVFEASLEMLADAGITAEFSNLGTKGRLRIKNTSGVTAYIRKLKIKANQVTYKKNNNIVKAGDNVTPTLKYKADYIHAYVDASNLANTLKDYYKYSIYTYSFRSKDDYALGSIVTINDNVWNSISNEMVLITGKDIKANGTIFYTCVGIDEFNVSAETSRDIILYSDKNTQTIKNVQLESATITIGNTEVALGGTVNTLDGVDITGSAYIFGNQKVYSRLIPGSNYEILTQQNQGQLLSDVFTIYELLAPKTSLTETTYAFHNIVNEWDDWVRDLSFHNYSGKMKSVDVISHFTGTNAGSWEWVSRYSTGTDYDMIERYLLTLEGDTGNLKLGEDNTIAPDTRGKLDVRQYGWTETPAAYISIDSSKGGSQPPAILATNGYNFAYSGNLLNLKLLNATDSGTMIKLQNAGTGNYITADSTFQLTKEGNIILSGSNGISNNFISGIFGTGWKLDYGNAVTGKSYLEVDNLMVRDTIRTHIFQKDVVKATNGQLYVSDSGVVGKTYDGNDPYILFFDVKKSATFNVNDVLIIKDINLESGTVTSTTKVQIDSVGTQVGNIQPYTVSVIQGTLWDIQAGMTAVRISGGAILIDASTTYSPFIDVLENSAVKTRMGNLNGVDGCSGYGLYSDNVFLTGKITANSGKIAGWMIQSDGLKATNAALYSNGTLCLSSNPANLGSWNTAGSIVMNAVDGAICIGNKLRYTVGDGLEIEGKITTSTGKIGDFNIGTYLNSGSKQTYDDGVAGVHIGSDGIGLGANFKVDTSGNLTTGGSLNCYAISDGTPYLEYNTNGVDYKIFTVKKPITGILKSTSNNTSWTVGAKIQIYFDGYYHTLFQTGESGYSTYQACTLNPGNYKIFCYQGANASPNLGKAYFYFIGVFGEDSSSISNSNNFGSNGTARSIG